MQISGGSPHRYYRCVSNRKRGVCPNRLSVRETLTRQRVLEAISSAIASTEAVAHIRRRLAERLAINDLRSQADAPIHLPPADLIAERVLALQAFTDSPDVDGARAALRRYLKGGEITLTPELFEGREAYVARAEFLPLVFLTENAETPSEGYQGGRRPRSVARGRFNRCTTRFRSRFALACPRSRRRRSRRGA